MFYLEHLGPYKMLILKFIY